MCPDGANPVGIQSRSKRISTGYAVTSKSQQSHEILKTSPIHTYTLSRTNTRAAFTRCLPPSSISPGHLSVFSDSHPD